MIALAIVDDADLQNYRLSCHFANDAADGDNGSFWRKRFLAHYDATSAGYQVCNGEYKRMYVHRQLRLGFHDRTGKSKSGDERRSLEVLRDLIAGMK